MIDRACLKLAATPEVGNCANSVFFVVGYFQKGDCGLCMFWFEFGASLRLGLRFW